MIVSLQFEKKPLLFEKPVSLITTKDPSSLEQCFCKMEQALKSGYYLAGFLSYEAGYYFEKCLWQDKKYDFPLIYMGVYGPPKHTAPKIFAASKAVSLKNLRLNISKEKYFENIEIIREHIRKGDVYQITYCLKLLFDACGSLPDLYARLLKEQPVPYPAYIESDDFHILSLSPEKFLKKQDKFIITKPMKGTWMRGRTFASDVVERLRFGRDHKNRAENVMIADLLRNDLGRLGQGIAAPRLFEITGYKTLFQMTSTVTATLPQDISLYQLFASLFPSGSVTGAPKIRAMEIIRGLEQEERHIYTGAIGYIAPNKDLFFNIPIRTLLIQNGRGEMGIGGGIVWDSSPLGEWNEGLLKARFVTETFGPAYP
ncbi:MAG: chorismate-binding protein [Candidatus Omnitrophica bacterium]|nr:chorismate-binding protein [Candidatus Omnitrophota bacterium]